MLVLSRKSTETILIGDNIKVTILRVGPTSVRIGIDAPRGMVVLRGELSDDDSDDDSAATYRSLTSLFHGGHRNRVDGHAPV